MAIQIKVSDSSTPDTPPDRTIKLKAKKALNGDIMVNDHPDLHIIVSRKDAKIITFPKTEMGEHTYHSQDDLFSYLADYGVISHGSMQGGIMMGSMEAALMSPPEGSKIDFVEVVLSRLYDYFQMEEPSFAMNDKFEDNEQERLTDPEVYTDLGDVPQAEKKGSIDPRFARRYYITYHF
jgi:hypothetical protein